MKASEQILELRKDILFPGLYIRAGKQKTKMQWEKIFPDAFQHGSNNEWFIDIYHYETPQIDLEQKIVNEMFKHHGLHSISYNQIAVKCIKKYQIIKDSKHQ